MAMMLEARRPVMYVGGGAVWECRRRADRALARMLTSR